MPRLSKIGAAALAAFGWTGLQTVTADYLVVAGGGAGGGNYAGGGGGGGGLLTGTTALNLAASYTVTVGAGGTGSSGDGTNGGNSVFSSFTATGGGKGGSTGYTDTGTAGGSGGGGSGATSSPSGGAGTSGQGNNGGAGAYPALNRHLGGGGGGAGAAGGAAGGTVTGNGGNGTASSISGSSVTYAGGGSGGSFANTNYGATAAGTPGTGGGGQGYLNQNGGNGTTNTGGGGGGTGTPSTSGGYIGGNGGSGIVIISYTGPQQFGGGVVTSSGGKTIHTFTTSGTLSPLASLSASYLVVAGGGGGACLGGGGGAGGMQTGSSLTIDTNSIYAISVGAGGIGGTNGVDPIAGSNSSFSLVTASIGGGKGGGNWNVGNNGGNGGSGGGGGNGYGAGLTGGTGTAGQGNNGGTVASTASPYYSGSGGGAGAAGSGAATPNNGGIGLQSSITGTSTYYAGGGAGTGWSVSGGTAGTGGSGGGGNGTSSSTGGSGTANTGGGGGASGYPGASIFPAGGNGGSGIVIISYPGSAAQMAGGTVTVAGGNVIHTFTSSGYLSPIVTLNKSLRFRASASAYLSRTPSVASNRRTWTWSGWVKRGVLTGDYPPLFNAGQSIPDTVLRFFDDDTINATLENGGGSSSRLQTSAVYRDPSAWYHIVWAVDTTQATADNRQRLYVNGVEITAFGTRVNPSQNLDTNVNNTVEHRLGSQRYPSFYDGYMAEINFIDGQQLTANSFGSFNGLGVWQPIRYGGSYGTNGFYLPFTNTTSTTTLVADSSPNGNNWTPNNISLTSGVTYDSMTDVPTNTSATVANYCVMNPLTTGSLTTLSGANLNLVQTSGSSVGNSRSSFAMLTGKWYFETTLTAANVGIYPQLGIMTARDGSRPNNDYPQAGYSTSSLDPTLSVIYMADGTKQTNGSASAYGSSFTNGDVIGIAIDSDNGAIYFSKNGVFQNSGVPTSGASKTGAALTWTGGTVEHVYSVAGYNGTAEAVNFGQRPFTYTPPSGFVALNTFNLPTPTIGATASSQAGKYFNPVLYSGNDSNRTITGVGFQPDFVWIKGRNAARFHNLFDAVRGAGYDLRSNSTNAEVYENDTLTAFASDGFSLGTDVTSGRAVNYTGDTYVAWNWNAGGSTVTNTSGSISAQVRASTTAGFSIVTYTGNATSGATVGHGLGVAPSMVIVKSRSNGTTNWCVYHISVGNQYATLLNRTDASFSNSNYWNNTSPTSSVFSLGNGTDTNQSTGTYVAYCFAAVAGYSAFGSYTGNGSTDGTFVYTGFRPRFVMIKRTDSGNNWFILDTSRNTFNLANAQLLPNSSAAESTNTDCNIDILSNGFKLRTALDASNANGGNYIYAAFAESPFKYANAR